ncbi:MAG: helix-hairpin-helix domain-containing protein [Desulfuromonadaceae bacterium]|nr:helix-hairpin-helix domain-containing protein [Desulfuromonadaceae bacterium]
MFSNFMRFAVLLVLVFTFSASTAIAAPGLNVNTATATQLQQVKGIGPKTAEKIVAYRQENGEFTSLDELKNIKGIGDKSLNVMTGSLSLE